MEGTEDWENAEDMQKQLDRMKMQKDLEEYKVRAKAEAKGS